MIERRRGESSLVNIKHVDKLLLWIILKFLNILNNVQYF